MSIDRIDRALCDQQLLGAALGDVAPWSTWLAVLRAAFGLPLSPAEAAVFAQVAGNRAPLVNRVREFWAVVGRRGGKSRIAAALAVFQAAFVEHKLAAGEVGHVLVLAASKDQARVVFDYIRAFFTASPILRREVRVLGVHGIRLNNGVAISVHSNSFRTVRGRTLLACIFDEVAMWRDELSAQPDLEVYRAVLPSLIAHGGMLIGISTPYRKTGLLYQKHRDHFATDSNDVLVAHGVHSADVVLNILARRRDPGPAITIVTPAALTRHRRALPRSRPTVCGGRQALPRGATLVARRSL